MKLNVRQLMRKNVVLAMSSNAQRFTSRSAPLLMSSSALPSMKMNAKQLTRKSAPRRDMAKRSVTQFLEKLAAKFQSSLAHRFPGSLATKSQEPSVEMYRGRNASRF